MILTSSFVLASLHSLPNQVSIARKAPKYWKLVRVYEPLAPSWSIIRTQDLNLYVKRYFDEVLNKLDPVKVLEGLGGDNFVMLCWEKPGEFCHRTLVGKWLEAAGADVQEFMPGLKRHLDLVSSWRRPSYDPIDETIQDWPE